MRTSAESFEASQNSRQAEDDVDKTRRKAIVVTRQQKHRQDQKDGHRYYGESRRQVIDKLEPVERVRRPTHSTGNVPTEDNRSATIHNNQPTRLHLAARRRTTFTVQPLRKGSVDQERLRRGKSSLPSLHITKTNSGDLNSTFFFSSFFALELPKEGAYGTRATATTTSLWTI